MGLLPHWKAAFLYTDPATGQDVVIDLPAPLRDIRTRVVQRRYVEEALDGTRSVKTIGPAHYELIGRIRFVDAPDAMLAMLHAAANGAQLVYTEDVTDPHAKTYTAELIWDDAAIELGMDADLGKIGRGEVTVVLRSSVPWGALYAGEDVLFRYRAGEPLSAAGMSFSRASGATLIDRTGTLREVGPDVPRIDWSHGRPALRLEGSRTNGWTWSEDLSQSVWIKNGVSVITDATAAPDGQVTMDKVVEDATTGVHQIQRALSGASDNAKQAISFWVAAAERTWVRIATNGKDSASAVDSFFNLATGEFGTVATAHSLRVIERAGSAYRLECVFDVSSGANTPQFRVGPTTGDATTTYTGDGTSGIYLWGLQFDADQPVASSYIKTTSTTVTRSADVLTVPWPYPYGPMTVYISGVELGITALSMSNRALWGIGGSGGNRVGIWGDNGRFEAEMTNGISFPQSTPELFFAFGDRFELVLRMFEDGRFRLEAAHLGDEPVLGPTRQLPPFSAWASPTMFIGARTAGTSTQGPTALFGLLVARGSDWPWDALRAIAGVAS